MKIQVVKVEGPITNLGKNNRPYKVVEILYTANGKPYTKKLTQFSDAYAVMAAAMPDQVFSVDLEKNGQYTEWKNVVADDGSEPAINEAVVEETVGRPKGSKNKPVASSTSVFARDDVRQELIVRQSSLSSAIEFFKANQVNTPAGVLATIEVEDVLKVAKEFRDFVYAVEKDASTA